MNALMQRVARVARKEAEAILRSLVPLRPDAHRCALKLGFRTIENLVAHFRRRKEPFFMGWTAHAGPSAMRVFRERFPNSVTGICKQADAICRGEVELHGYRFHADGVIQWHRDPISREQIPVRYWRYYRFSTFDEFPDDSSDPIILFKLHTHQHLCRLGQAYRLTGSEHYIDALNAQLAEWIREFPVGHGYPYLIVLNVAQRLISWCIIYALARSSQRFMDKLLPLFLHALALQARFVYRSLSVHGATNNFVLTECVALWMVAQFFPEFPESSRWKARALDILKRELPKQILPDGTSFEKSTGYQRFVAELLILLCSSEQAHPSQQVDARNQLQGILSSLLYLSGPDGNMPQLGDVSLERAFWLTASDNMCDVRELFATGATLLNDVNLKWGAQGVAETVLWLTGLDGIAQFDSLDAYPPMQASKLFPDGGFAILRDSWREPNLQVVVDCGDVGLAGSGGHGHNDVLSFVLWKGKQPVFIDPGTYTYFASRRWRDAFRGTASHNVVQVDGAEIADLGPGLFQISSGARAIIHRWEVNEDLVILDAAHIGYRRFAQPVMLRRQFLLLGSRAVILRDQVEGEGEHDLVWRFHCAPGVLPSVLETGDLHLKLPNGESLVLVFLYQAGANWRLEEGWFSPYYGKKIAVACPTLAVRVALPAVMTIGMIPVASTEMVDPMRIADVRAALEQELNACIFFVA